VDAREERVKKILFVCTAGVCRSPMAAAIFDALAEDRALPFRAESAGVAALEGNPMAPNALVALEEAGIYPQDHSARQVSAPMLEEADLVLVLSTRMGGGTTTMSGTSMAAPHVGGGAALYLSWNTSASPSAVEAALTSSAWAPSYLSKDGRSILREYVGGF
jgi:hypothetical protein